MAQLSGAGNLYHLKYIWKPSWTIKILLKHIISLLKTPDFSLLPNEMNQIVDLKVQQRNANELRQIEFNKSDWKLQSLL